MTTLRAVFLDTVGLLALWDKRDQWHTAAERAFGQISLGHPLLYTTTYILLECGNAAARRPYRLSVDRLRETSARGGTLITPTQDDWQLAWEEYRKGAADHAGIVDQVSFVVMRRPGISAAFTNDHHFRAAGFQALF